MPNQVGDDAIKISLIQTLPGEEFSVVEMLETACVEKGVEKFTILKGFGAYDIIFIFAAKDFSPALTDHGPIDAIIKTTKSFCYHHKDGASDDFFERINNSIFVAITIIKIHTNHDLSNFSSESNIIDELNNKSTSRNYFGTLGWSELIAIYHSDDIKKAIDACLFTSSTKTYKYIKKTYSIISLNYKKIPYKVEGAAQITNLCAELKNIPSLDKEVSKHIRPLITVTCFPGANKELVKYWHNNKYQVFDVIGKEDIEVLPRGNIKWYKLISDLLRFRYEYRHRIHSTTTYISVASKECSDLELSEQQEIPLFTYDFTTLKELFAEKALPLAGTLNTLRGLIQNRMVNDAFRDMANYPEFIVDFAKHIRNDQRGNFVTLVTESINRGAELRLYGTYGTIEENVGQFNKFRGGVHRSLQAISFIPFETLNRTIGGGGDNGEGYNWKGFIGVSNRHFSSDHEVIHIPTEALWNPGMWWAVNHESAHIIINNIVREKDGRGIIDREITELKMFLASKNTPDHWLQFVTELAAEYIGYELGFFSDYELFLVRVWHYLKELAPMKALSSHLSIYAIRTYSVSLFERYLIYKTIDDDYISDYDKIYEEIVAHIEKIEKIGGDDTSDDVQLFYRLKYITAAYYAPKFKSLIPWMKNVFGPVIDDIECRRDKSELSNSNTEEVFSSIEKGAIWDGEIKFPEAVLYKIYQKHEMAFKSNTAAIVTFWHLYKTRRNSYV